jgi:hypothetical protein
MILFNFKNISYVFIKNKIIIINKTKYNHLTLLVKLIIKKIYKMKFKINFLI